MRVVKLSREEWEKVSLSVLRAIGRAIGVKSPTTMPKEPLIDNIMGIEEGRIKPEVATNKGAPTKSGIDISAFIIEDEDMGYYASSRPSDYSVITFHDSNLKDDEELVEGYLELHHSGYGFLRCKNKDGLKIDVFVSQANIKKYHLRRGDKVRAAVKVEREGESPAIQNVILINDVLPTVFMNRDPFDELTACYPTEKLKLEVAGAKNDLSVRVIDLFAPIGKGQRGLIVAPPKTGKTTLIKEIAKSIEKNYPEATLLILLIDERPEEVTDIKECVSSEVIYSTFDESPSHHVRTAEFAVDRAKRVVESSKDAIILMDSITRLARAYNTIVESSGKTLSGGLDPNAMQGPKRFFGSGRNTRSHGSLTIISTALIETGSRMDDVIFEEFKGTGNHEIYLSRDLAEKRIFPAIDLYKSGTRKEEVLLTESELLATQKIRKLLSEREDATEVLLNMMEKTENNEQFISKLDGWLKVIKK